jgi:hypothetical protein
MWDMGMVRLDLWLLSFLPSSTTYNLHPTNPPRKLIRITIGMAVDQTAAGAVKNGLITEGRSAFPLAWSLCEAWGCVVGFCILAPA